MGHSVSVHFRFPSTLQKMFSSKSCKGRENRVEMTPPFRNWSHILLLISKKPEALHVRLFFVFSAKLLALFFFSDL